MYLSVYNKVLIQLRNKKPTNNKTIYLFMNLFGLGKREQVNSNLFYMVGGLKLQNKLLLSCGRLFLF